jgi:hypothetical protein
MKRLLAMAMLLWAAGPANAQQDGYVQNTRVSDGPFIYGTGLTPQDRAKAWNRLFLIVVESCAAAEGMDTVATKLAKRCQADEDFCTIAIDANLIGIGGIREPQKVRVIAAFDRHAENKKLSRIICTWPADRMRECKDWDTGELPAHSLPFP